MYNNVTDTAGLAHTCLEKSLPIFPEPNNHGFALKVYVLAGSAFIANTLFPKHNMVSAEAYLATKMVNRRTLAFDLCTSSLLFTISILSMDESRMLGVLAATALNISMHYISNTLVKRNVISNNGAQIITHAFNFLNICTFAASMDKLGNFFQGLNFAPPIAKIFSKSIVFANSAFLSQYTEDTLNCFNRGDAIYEPKSSTYLVKYASKLAAHSMKILGSDSYPWLNKYGFYFIIPCFDSFVKWYYKPEKYTSMWHFSCSSLSKTFAYLTYGFAHDSLSSLGFSCDFPSPYLFVLDMCKAVLKEIGEIFVERQFSAKNDTVMPLSMSVQM